MKELIKLAEQLQREIKLKQKEIDNPVLVMGIRSELDFFIQNVEEREGD